jgi:tetratricopeptide (TPR) repeat protein
MDTIEDLLNKSVDLYKNNKFHDALEILEKIKSKDDSRIYFLIGTIYASVKNIKLAEKNLIEALRINQQNPLIFHNLGTVMAMKSDTQSAKKYYLKAIEINNHIDSMSELGKLYSDENNFEEAKKYFEMIFKIDKNHKKTNLRIGNMYMKIDEHKKGLKYIQNATGLIRFSEEGFKII